MNVRLGCSEIEYKHALNGEKKLEAIYDVLLLEKPRFTSQCIGNKNTKRFFGSMCTYLEREERNKSAETKKKVRNIRNNTT